MTLRSSLAAAALLPALCGAALAQTREDREKQREFDREVSDALVEFGKAMRGGDEAAQIEAIKAVAELKHKKVVAEIGRLTYAAPSDRIRKEAIIALSNLSHPDAAAALVQAWETNIGKKELVAELIKATEKQRWDSLARASYVMFDKVFDAELNTLLGDHQAMLRSLKPLSAVDGLISFLEKMEKTIRQIELGGGENAGNIQVRKDVLSTLRLYSGQDFKDFKEAELWWKRSRALLERDCIVEYWCEKTWEHWEKLANDKRKCPHHQDETRKSVWQEMPCLLKPK